MEYGLAEESVEQLAEREEVPILAESVPVTMPELPATLRVETVEQFRAASDPIRVKILGIIQTQPATAKQIAERLGATPGAIGHHLHILEETGLAQVVARRLVRGVVAKYYTRTARLFEFSLPPELVGLTDHSLDIMTIARAQLAEAIQGDAEAVHFMAFPHARLGPERAQHYQERLEALLADLLAEPVDPAGQSYGVCLAFFASPAYLQAAQPEAQNQGKAEN